MLSMFSSSTVASGPPWGLRWRSSVWFVTLVVGFGVATDLFAYAVIIPVIPFRLEALGYSDSSARTGWLLFAYSGGLAVSTPPIAWFSERYNARRAPLLLGLFTLMGSQVMFMLAPFYWLMALARIIQGCSSTFVWTVGLALLCDTAPEARVGQQLGLAMAGLSAGVVLAPPIGGSLYQRLGFNAPFIFSIGVVLVDLIGRLLVIERKDALKWGFDPAGTSTNTADLERTSTIGTSRESDKSRLNPDGSSATHSTPVVIMAREGGMLVLDNKHKDAYGSRSESDTRISSAEPTEDVDGSARPKQGEPSSPIILFDPAAQLSATRNTGQDDALKRSTESLGQAPPGQEGTPGGRERDTLPQLPKSEVATPITDTPQLSSMQVLTSMCRSRRALAAFCDTLIFGISYSAQEPTLPLRLQDPYGMSSLKVGLVYIASSVPTLMSGPIAGWLSDRKGTGIITIVCILLGFPWFIVMIIHSHLSLLIIGVVLSNFFISAIVAPLTAELAAVTRELPGVGYSHVYGAFNLAYGIGSAVGPILGGQLFDRVRDGWTAVIGVISGLMLVAAVIAFFFMDEVPVSKRLLGMRRKGPSRLSRGPEA